MSEVRKTTTTDDETLENTLKRMVANTIPAIEEVNIFMNDQVIQFQYPKVQAAIAVNAWVVSGTPQIKRKDQVTLPGTNNQLDNLDSLMKLAEQFQKAAALKAATEE